MSITTDDKTSANLIAPDPEVTDQWARIDSLADLLEADGRLSDREAYTEAVYARKKETGGTAIEVGLAIPHAKSGGVAILSKEEG